MPALVDLNTLSLRALFAALAADGSLDRLIEAALAEDFGDAGDVTSEALIAPGIAIVAQMRARSAGVVAGLARAVGQGWWV